MESFSSEHKAITPEITHNITVGLVKHLYSDAKSSILASIFCATVLFYGLYDENQDLFLYWYIFSLSVTAVRFVLLSVFSSGRFDTEKHIILWRNLFIIGAVFGGISWGIVSYWIFPVISDPLKILTILILAGVTAGGTPSLASSKAAAISFLWIILAPLVVQIEYTHTTIYSLFGLTAIVYLLYLTLFALRMNKTIKNVLQLQYENISLLKKLKYLATHDPLTNLDNSRLFYDNLLLAMERANEKTGLLALLYIDLDKFKFVNDHYGHLVGDKVLKYATDVIRQQLRPNDFLARLGGDEFAVILENVVQESHLIQIANRICEKIEKPFLIDNIEVNISASIGISLYPSHGKNMDELIQAADHAMYHVKKHGRNSFYLSKEAAAEDYFK